MGNSPSRAETPSGEPPSGKIDLAVLVRKHTLSNQELFALVKGLIAWPPEQLDGLPDALHLEFRDFLGPSKRRDNFVLRWGPDYFYPPLHEEEIRVWLAWHPEENWLKNWLIFRAVRDDPHPEKKGAVLAIQIAVRVGDRFWPRVFRHVKLAFRKGRVSLKEAELVRAWGKPRSSDIRSHLDPEGRDVPYSDVWYRPAEFRSDIESGDVEFQFNTASSEEVPLEVCVYYPRPKPHGPRPENGLMRAIREAAQRLNAKRSSTNPTP
ncbi:hypothetical protein MAMC_00691 [Methylacidimicrobium cyclopophantes]|uniref:Uncharacterized protein n=1 Tax=Methylacidimicrobium cyclopophantes TaxID=1041766 RepID=A0A5E6M7Q1_9BACT|nr:hypothetical protein [Methylacidimicrobium cyclopophantes]VVM05580.1 hypothetical protein MAMC_00691 [Methylacidimicrobium cyclopophantes]